MFYSRDRIDTCLRYTDWVGIFRMLMVSNGFIKDSGYLNLTDKFNNRCNNQNNLC